MAIEVIDGAEVIRSVILAETDLEPDEVYKGPKRPPNRGVGIPEDSVYINDQGGLPPTSYLNREGQENVPYYDTWVRHSSVGEGRKLVQLIQSVVNQADVGNFDHVTKIQLIHGPVYSGRDRHDLHLWRVPFKVKVQEYYEG